VDIHNRIYKEQIYNYMTIKLELDSLIRVHLRDYNLHQDFTLPDNSLNVELILLKFQEFMRQEYSQRDRPFLERNGRLIFLAFIKPIINGRGYDFKEVQISEEKRLDVVIVFDQRKYIVELKLWRGEQAHQKGLQQLHDYLDWTGLDTGYLIIFDFTQKKKQLAAQARLQVESKEIFVVWV
jgi:hypothetical protein